MATNTNLPHESHIMGILNITPDSFSNGGKYLSVDSALIRAHQLCGEGAHIIDIGGESSRPGAVPISTQEELDRVIPVVQKIHSELPVLISVDTTKAEVMREAIKSGVYMINDISALSHENCLATVAASDKVRVCLMHMQGEPRTMQQNPSYDDVISEVKSFLLERIEMCLNAGIAASRIMIDPGFGFGKTLTHNLRLMNELEEITKLGYPVVVGVSRKSMLGTLLNKPLEQRLYGGLALAVFAVIKGAAIIRTHDVAATVDALKVTQAVLETRV